MRQHCERVTASNGGYEALMLTPVSNPYLLGAGRVKRMAAPDLRALSACLGGATSSPRKGTVSRDDIFDLASDYCAAVFTGDTLNADAIRYELRRLGMFADHDDKRFACIVAGTHSLLAYPLDCEIVEDTHHVTLYKLDTDSACRHFARLVA